MKVGTTMLTLAFTGDVMLGRLASDRLKFL